MSTRSVIARATKTGFSGTYHHWDGYPKALGATLWEVYHGHFKRDLTAMLDFLVDQHIWSTINGADFSMPPGFREHVSGRDQPHGPECFCHGDRHEKRWTLTERTASASGCEFAYVFDVDQKTMNIMGSYRDNGNKMIGQFGHGDPEASWSTIATVDLEGEEPDFSKIQELAFST